MGILRQAIPMDWELVACSLGKSVSSMYRCRSLEIQAIGLS